MSSKGRTASGREGVASISSEHRDPSDRLIALERALARRIDRADRLSDELVANASELARKETLLAIAAARAESAEREQALSAGRTAAVLDEINRRREEAASMARDLASTADKIARAERETDVQKRHADRIAAEVRELKKRLEARESELAEAKAGLAQERARQQVLAEQTPPSAVAPAAPAPAAKKSLRKRLGPLAILAAPLLLFKKRPKAKRLQAVRPPSSDQEAMDLISRSGLFDGDWYLTKYPDVRAAGIDPLHHYFHHGGAEARKPGPRFDPRWYRDQVGEFSGNPLIHYLTQGRARGIEVPSLDDTALHDHPDVLEIVNSPLFDPDWYRARCPGLPKGREHVAHHYLTSGWLNGLNPGPLFDGDAYLRRYEDVRDARTNPLLHYLRHGRGERREAFAVDGTQVQRKTSSPEVRGGQRSHSLFEDGAGAPSRPDEAQTEPWVWIDADNFDDATPSGTPVRLGEILIGHRDSPADDLTETLATFARLSGLAAADDPGGHLRFRTGRERLIHDAWFLTRLDLRIRLALSQDGPCVVRAYQVCLDGNGVRRLKQAAFDPTGMSVLDATLLNPLSPVLLCVDDGQGRLSDVAILAFPSLARGGLHHGELVAADAHDALEAYGAELAAQWLDPTRGPLFISALRLDDEGAIGGEPIFERHLQAWLSAAMRLSPGSSPAGPPHSGSAFGPERNKKGATLVLPGDSVPTLAVLTRRSPGLIGRDGPGAVILADAVRFRPRWQVTPPVGLDGLSDLQPSKGGNPWPVLENTGRTGTDDGGDGADSLLAIRFREARDASSAQAAFPFAPDMPGPILRRKSSARPARISVILNVGEHADQDTVLATTRSLAEQAYDGSVELLIVSSAPCPDVLANIQPLFPSARAIVDPGSLAARLNLGALRAKGRSLLFVDAGMVLHDKRTLQTLSTIVEVKGVASAGCATIQPSVGGDAGRRLVVHGAGVFPDHISFRARPQLMLGEPTTPSAMMPAAYAVAATRFRLALVPRSAWNAVGGLDDLGFPEADHDLDFGLRALKLNMIHVCTSAVAATALGGAPLGRPGSLSPARLSIRDWSAALGRMTIVRALS